MIDHSAEPQDFTLRLLSGFRVSRLVWLVARYRLADLIGDGPTSAAEIADQAGTHPDSTRRLLDALTATGLFRSEGDGVYGPTPASALLRSDHPRSQREWIELSLGGAHFEAWAAIETTLCTGQTAFDARHGTSWLDYNIAHPEAGQVFAGAMSATTRAYEEAILGADPFPSFSTAVDIGGSEGSLLRALLARNPDAKGIVFDLPDVIAAWSDECLEDLDGRLTSIGGDFFEAVPPGDLYLLKMILHDWDDERSATILRRVREAAGAGALVAIVESVLPASPAEHPGWLMDVNMMVLTGGRERTASAFQRLLERTGWRLDRVVPTRSPLSVVLAAAA